MALPQNDFRDVGSICFLQHCATFARGRDQAADENLHLLAQAMLGLARRHTLWASDFLKIADHLGASKPR